MGSIAPLSYNYNACTIKEYPDMLLITDSFKNTYKFSTVDGKNIYRFPTSNGCTPFLNKYKQLYYNYSDYDDVEDVEDLLESMSTSCYI